MDILTLHHLPALNNARRKWLRELNAGDRVFSCSYTDYVDEAGYGKGEFEEGYVLSKGKEIVVCFNDATTLRHEAASGRWIDDEGDQPCDSEWIVPAVGEVASQLRRILSAADVIEPNDLQRRAHLIAQLRRMISGTSGEGTQAAAERILTHTLQLKIDMGQIDCCTFLTEAGVDPLAVK